MKNILKKMKRIILAQTVKVSIVTSAAERKLEGETILITGGAKGSGKSCHYTKCGSDYNGTPGRIIEEDMHGIGEWTLQIFCL